MLRRWVVPGKGAWWRHSRCSGCALPLCRLPVTQMPNTIFTSPCINGKILFRFVLVSQNGSYSYRYFTKAEWLMGAFKMWDAFIKHILLNQGLLWSAFNFMPCHVTFINAAPLPVPLAAGTTLVPLIVPCPLQSILSYTSLSRVPIHPVQLKLISSVNFSPTPEARAPPFRLLHHMHAPGCSSSPQCIKICC